MNPALILLPGLDGTGRLFSDFVAALGPEADVVVVSYPTDQCLSYHELVAFVRPFLPRDRPYVILAESFSGPIGIALAASAPDGLVGLILSCSFSRKPLPILTFMRPFLGVVPKAALTGPLPGFFALGRFSTPALRAELAQALSLVSWDVMITRIRALLSVDVSEMLGSVGVPVLYLRATQDRLVHRALSKIVISHVSDAQIIDFNAPHLLLQAAPVQCSRAVMDFMLRVSKKQRFEPRVPN